MNNIVEDVLLYLPEWTTKPKKNREKINTFMEDNDFKIFTDEEKKHQKEVYEDINIRKHIPPKEILQTFHITKIRAATFLNRTKVPSTNICYNAVCMWTAGVLEEKYKFKSNESQLIKEAKQMIQPYFNHQFKILGQKHHKIPPEYNNHIKITVKEKTKSCLENIPMT